MERFEIDELVTSEGARFAFKLRFQQCVAVLNQFLGERCNCILGFRHPCDATSFRRSLGLPSAFIQTHNDCGGS